MPTLQISEHSYGKIPEMSIPPCFHQTYFSLSFFHSKCVLHMISCVFPATDDDRPNDDVTANGLWPSANPYSNCHDDKTSKYVSPLCTAYATLSNSIPPLCHHALPTNATPSLCHGFPSTFSYASTETQPIPTTVHEGWVHECPQTPLCYVKTNLTSSLSYGPS